MCFVGCPAEKGTFDIRGNLLPPIKQELAWGMFVEAFVSSIYGSMARQKFLGILLLEQK